MKTGKEIDWSSGVVEEVDNPLYLLLRATVRDRVLDYIDNLDLYVSDAIPVINNG